MEKLITRSWDFTSLNGRTSVSFYRLFSDGLGKTRRSWPSYRKVSRSSFKRLEVALNKYVADNSYIECKPNMLYASHSWSTLRHHNGVMMTREAYQKALAYVPDMSVEERA